MDSNNHLVNSSLYDYGQVILYCRYLLEQSLSVDNLFVFVLIFRYFKVPKMYQVFLGLHTDVLPGGFILGLYFCANIFVITFKPRAGCLHMV